MNKAAQDSLLQKMGHSPTDSVADGNPSLMSPVGLEGVSRVIVVDQSGGRGTLARSGRDLLRHEAAK